MQLIHLLVILSITLAPSLTQQITPNAVKSLLQVILSPKNSEPMMQMLSTAAKKKRAVVNVPGFANRRFVVADNMPRAVTGIEVPNRMIQVVERPQEMCMKNNIEVPNLNNIIVQKGNQIVVPKNMIVQGRTETVLPRNVVIKNGAEVTLPRNVIVRQNDMPKRMVVQNNEFALRAPQMRVPEVVQQKTLIPQPQVAEFMPMAQQKVLRSQPMGTEYITAPQQRNPFLPAASPVSGLAASSSNVPPSAMPQSRGQFLRKIPIPPPTI